MRKPILVTGGAGFIGSNFVLHRMLEKSESVVNVDKLTYAGNLHNLESIASDGRHKFVQGDIGDRALLHQVLETHRPTAIVHFAAESHVDRSIRGPEDFIRTNVDGTFALLEETRAYWGTLPDEEKKSFRFLHVSTDEVYGSLGPDDPPFSETTPYAPNSPYAASKAASDHLVRAYHHTYGLPTLTTNCSNNYGRFQFPEKLIPLMILNARDGKALAGLWRRQERPRLALCRGSLRGDRYRVASAGVLAKRTTSAAGTRSRTSRSCRRSATWWMRWRPRPTVPVESLITYVKDRPGHDRRYAMDARKIERELGWKPKATFESGIRKTVRWYLDNEAWVRDVTSGSYRQWVATHYSGLVTSRRGEEIEICKKARGTKASFWREDRARVCIL